MIKISLLFWSDSNIAGDYWTWFVTLTIRKNKTFSVGAFQTSAEYPTYKLPSIYPLKSGRQVRVAIEKIFSDDNLSEQMIDWDEIVSTISKHVPQLASEIHASFEEDAINESVEEKRLEEKELIDKPINDWISQSSWPRSTLRDAYGMGAGRANSARKKIIVTHIKTYLSEHGHLPSGQHKINDSFEVTFPETNYKKTGK
jgi:hypothetical protein